jgi:hypothetical protein
LAFDIGVYIIVIVSDVGVYFGVYIIIDVGVYVDRGKLFFNRSTYYWDLLVIFISSYLDHEKIEVIFIPATKCRSYLTSLY